MHALTPHMQTPSKHINAHTQTAHTHPTHTHITHTHTGLLPLLPLLSLCSVCHFYFLSPHPGVEHHSPSEKNCELLTVGCGYLAGVHSGLPFMDTSGIYLQCGVPTWV